MATSQNGLTANVRALTKQWRIPSTGRHFIVRRGYNGYILAVVAAWFDEHVERIGKGQWDDWGYAEREIRGYSRTLSNHASGSAIDVNATRHPLGTDPRANFSAKQIANIHRLVTACGGAVRWGGDYRGRKDGMHFELVGTAAQRRACARRMKRWATGRRVTRAN